MRLVMKALWWKVNMLKYFQHSKMQRWCSNIFNIQNILNCNVLFSVNVWSAKGSTCETLCNDNEKELSKKDKNLKRLLQKRTHSKLKLKVLLEKCNIWPKAVVEDCKIELHNHWSGAKCYAICGPLKEAANVY